MANDRALADRMEESPAFAEKALELSARVGLPTAEVRGQQFRGMARQARGDHGGVQDLRDSLKSAQGYGLGWETARAHNNLADATWFEEGPGEGLAVIERGVEFAERRGATFERQWLWTSSMLMLYHAGRCRRPSPAVTSSWPGPRNRAVPSWARRPPLLASSSTPARGVP